MKFIFVIVDFNIGGITSSLRNLTNELVKNDHQVNILNLSRECKVERFNKKIKFQNVSGKAKYWNICMDDVHGSSGIKKIKYLFVGMVKKIMNHYGRWNQFIFSELSLDEVYDYAVAFRQEPISYYIVCNKINCQLKVGFWHICPDYQGNTSDWDKCIYDMDVIAGVSNDVCKQLKKRYSNISVATVYNLFDKNIIETLSKSQKKIYDNDIFNIVTVSRIEFLQKNLDKIPEICKLLIEENIVFQWMIVGDGSDFNSLNTMIIKNGLTKYIKLVGNKTNPYPYIKQADLFVLLSTCESYGMVIVESLILHTPIVSAEYPALWEIIENGKTGIIAKNTDKDIYNCIKKMIVNKEYYNMIKANCNEYKYSSELAYGQFISLHQAVNQGANEYGF